MTRRVVLAALALVLALPAQALAAPPPNDDFADAFELGPQPFGAGGGTAEATREPGEPAHAGDGTSPSVWFRFRPATSGSVTVDTCGSQGANAVAVYSGTQLGSLTEEGADAGMGCGAAIDGSKVELDAVAGVTYSIAVAGPPTQFELVFLIGDDLADAPDFGRQASEFLNNRSAGSEQDEPAHGGSGRSVWRNLQAARTGAVTIDTCGLFGTPQTDTVLAVYTGDTFPLTPVTGAANDDTAGCGNGSQSRVSFNATAGVTYHVAVDTKVAGGPVELALIQNDDFQAATTLDPFSSFYDGSTAAAAKEPGEPDHEGDPGGRSVWFEITAPRDGAMVFDTCNSAAFDTLLDAYTGPAVDSLTRVPGAVTTGCGAGATGRRLMFTATAGQSYHVALDGAGGAGGRYGLRVSVAPHNDRLADASELGPGPDTFFGETVAAGAEAGEPDHGTGHPASHSVWFRFALPAKTPVEIDTCGDFGSTDFDTLLAVYTGPANPTALTPVPGAANDDAGCGPAGTASRVAFTADAGTTYWIALDGKNGASGRFELRFEVPLANDDFADAQRIGKRDFVTGDSTAATAEPGEPPHAGEVAAKSVWYRLSPASGGGVTLDTCDFRTAFDTRMAVYTGTGLAGLAEVTSDDDDCANGSGSRVAFNADAGTDYWIAVDGEAGASGRFMLRAEGGPDNDDLDGAFGLSPTFGGGGGSNELATAQPSENAHAGSPALKSVWFDLRTPVDGAITLDTCTGTNFDTRLAVYTGDTFPLTPVPGAANDDTGGCGGGTRSRVQFQAEAGTTYRVAVDGKGGASGFFQFEIGFLAANDAFAAAAVIDPNVAFAEGDSSDATAEAGEPAHSPGQPATRSLWFSYTAPRSGEVTVDTCGGIGFEQSEFDSAIAVYTGTAFPLTAVPEQAPARPCEAGLDGERSAFVATAGVEYRIAVDGAAGDGGGFFLTLSTNDAFAAAQPFGLPGGGSASTAGFPQGATKEPGEPNHDGDPGGRSIWYRFTPASDGEAELHTCGGAISGGEEPAVTQLLAVYEGAALGALSPVPGIRAACGGMRGTGRRLIFRVTAGTTYRIAADGQGGVGGPFELILDFRPDGGGATPPPSQGGSGGEQPGGPVGLPGPLGAGALAARDALAIRTGSSITASARGVVAVRIVNTGPTRYSGTVAIGAPAFRGARAAARTVRLGSRSFRVAPGRTAKVTIRLSRAGRRQLARKRRLKATVTVTARDAQGVRQTASRKVTIKAPRALRRPRG